MYNADNIYVHNLFHKDVKRLWSKLDQDIRIINKTHTVEQLINDALVNQDLINWTENYESKKQQNDNEQNNNQDLFPTLQQNINSSEIVADMSQVKNVQLLSCMVNNFNTEADVLLKIALNDAVNTNILESILQHPNAKDDKDIGLAVAQAFEKLYK